MATLGAGLVVMGLYVGFDAARHRLGELEVSYSPVLKDVAVCSGQVDKASGACVGELVHYEDFVQTSAACDGRDAIVSGTMSKVRADAEYIDGSQTIFFTRPDGVMRRAFFEFEDQQGGVPTSRPSGVQDWGPWRLLGGCVTAYTQWFTVVEHRPWHGLFPLTTRSDAFPLPRATVD